MFDLNLQNTLRKDRDKHISSEDLKDMIQAIFDQKEAIKSRVKSTLETPNNSYVNTLTFDALDLDKIFHIDSIKKLCINYRLRFLDTHLFKGEYPKELYSIIPNLENDHKIQLKDFKIMAPSKLFRLKTKEDPLLFVPIGNGYYYLVHKWGEDLKSYRKILVWPFKNINTLIFTSIILSLLSTAIGSAFFNDFSDTQLLVIFIFNIKTFVFVTFYLLFMMRKNFNESIWNSKYKN
ncbi:MAG: hypothetical protein CMC56_03270 [Flavobacteriaceae bacterium]|jgi:hypothetical protein|nr:hypothetical protein [Flavobacteriaceae bacterium]|tara:strand:- start:18838 stop:19542 length:705 start_codon:yes stop_codon:yes gene_type:complete